MNNSRPGEDIWMQVQQLDAAETLDAYDSKLAWQQLHNRLQHTRRRRKSGWLRAAAVWVLLAGVGTVLYTMRSAHTKTLITATRLRLLKQNPAEKAIAMQLATRDKQPAVQTPPARESIAYQTQPVKVRPVKEALQPVTALQQTTKNLLVVEVPALQQAASIPVVATSLPARNRFRKAHINELTENAYEYMTAEQMKKTYSVAGNPAGPIQIQTDNRQRIPFLNRVKEK